MAKDKLKAMPKTKYFGTKTKEQTTNRINDSKETIVFHFILPTAESMFPNKFLEINYIKEFQKKYPKVKIMIQIGRNIL